MEMDDRFRQIKALGCIVNGKNFFEQIESNIYFLCKIKETAKTLRSPGRVEVIDHRITLAVFRAIDGDCDKLISLEMQDWDSKLHLVHFI